MRSRRWRLGENAKIEYDIVQTGAREMYEAYRDTIDEYGLEAARSVIEKSKSADIACMLRCAKHDAQKYMKKEEPMAIMVPEFGRAYMYWMLSEQFGGMVTDGQIRQEADYDKTVERAVEEYRSKYSSDDEMIRSTAKEYVRQTTQSIMMSRLGLMYEKAHKSKKLQKARRDAFESLRFLAENYDGIITVDELLAITKAYKPLVDPNPHKATGTINETNRNDDLVLRKVPHLDKKETPLERASMCNPHYGDKPYDNNCQCCVVTYEARARGYDATAGPAKWDHYWAQCFENADQIWLKSRFPDDRQAEIEKQMAEWGDGARAVVRVTWDDKSWGHVFVAEQIDGVTHYFEPQVPSAPNASEQTTHYFCDSMNVSLTRMDNLPMKDWAQTRVESRSV